MPTQHVLCQCKRQQHQEIRMSISASQVSKASNEELRSMVSQMLCEMGKMKQLIESAQPSPTPATSSSRAPVEEKPARTVSFATV